MLFDTSPTIYGGMRKEGGRGGESEGWEKGKGEGLPRW